MPRQTEPSANNALGGLLRSMLPGSEVRSEHIRVIEGRPGLQPDLLITDPGRAPVVIEAEYLPAANVETEAQDRLGLPVTVHPRPIEAAIALRYPADVGDVADLRAALTAARLEYCVFTEEAAGVQRFPGSGWLAGAVEDLADLVRLVSVPQREVDAATDTLQGGIDAAAKLLDAVDDTRPGITRAMAHLLGMENVPQTRRMACAIIANALVFHERIAGMHNQVQPLQLVCGDAIANPQDEVLTAWTAILKINYWPIFAIAQDLLSQLQAGDAADILRRLRKTAQEISATGVDQAHDLTGRIFQRLIADRKYLATFYTLPASAALLARLAVAKLDSVDWADADAIGTLRVADFACGTGALLSAVYERLAARHERAGGNPAALHRVMMEEVLYGCDVMPSAIHITGATLSGVQPAVAFGNTRLYTFSYGRQKNKTVKIGSLELLHASAERTLSNTSDPALRTGSVGEETAAEVYADIPHESFDLVIMNPPFTRNTNKAGGRANAFAPAFAAFNASKEDQRDMAKRMAILSKGTCYHGHAGMASAFAALAHRKLKPGGVLALVLPLSASAGFAWQGFRNMLKNRYMDVTIMSIAAADNDNLSFSADTGMAECLVIARKFEPDEPRSDRAHFTSLRHRPQGFAHASAAAMAVGAGGYVRQIEDGPYGGTPLMIGDELAGEMLTAPSQFDDDGWGAVRLSDYSLAQAAYALSKSKLWLPGSNDVIETKTVTLNTIGKLGFHHLDITGLPSRGPPQGPFSKIPPSPTATYPALWNHNAKAETRIACDPDSQLQVRPGMEDKAVIVWSTASRAHLNLDFRFNSQPLGVALTDRKSIGGRAWPNVNFDNPQFDNIFAVWCNGTLGLLCFWWHSNRQVAGRGITTKTSAETLPVLDFRTLSDEQLRQAETIFDEFRDLQLQPAYLADADPNRALLDRRVICDLLGFDEATYAAVRRLAAKWCAEPSVHGGKKRPRGARLVI